MLPQKCSLRTIAKACQCSVATVSMALRGMGRVPTATRQRIERMAAELGYVRDLEMSRLMSRARCPTQPAAMEKLVFLSELPIGAKTSPRLPWLQDMFRAAREAAHLLGYELEPIKLPAAAALQQKLSRTLQAQGVRGLIAAPVTRWSPAVLRFDWSHFACVEIGTTIQEPSLHQVARSYYDDLLAVYEHLRAKSYRRIGIALSDTRREYMRHMPEATLLLFQQQHPEMQPVTPMSSMQEWNPQGLKRWLKEQKPDVMLVYETAVPAWLRRLKIRVPQELGVVYLNSLGGRQTGLVPDTNLLAREAIHFLVRLVEAGEWGLPSRARSHRFRNIFNTGETI